MLKKIKIDKNKFLKRIFITATEQSGDNLGKDIIIKLKKNYPKIIVDGIGGSKMKPLMNKQIYNLSDFKSIGIYEIIFSILKYIQMINHLSKFILYNKYDLLITIDSPDFSYPLAKKVRKKGFKGKIFQVVAPTVWAWREYRAKNFASIYDEIFTLFQFENKYFEKYKLKATCIGHPIYYIKKKNNKRQKKYLIAFLPGSRLGEINSLFSYFQQAYEELHLNKNINLQIFIPTLPHLKKDILLKTKFWKIKTIITTEQYKIEKLYDHTKIALVCSGTASIEIAKRKIPQLVIYKLHIITEFIASFFVKIRHANIFNIISKKNIIPEITNSSLNKNIFIKNFRRLLLDEASNINQIKKINEIIKKIELKKSPHEIFADRLKKIL